MPEKIFLLRYGNKDFELVPGDTIEQAIANRINKDPFITKYEDMGLVSNCINLKGESNGFQIGSDNSSADQ